MNELIINQDSDIARQPENETIGQLANSFASQNIFQKEQSKKSHNTNRRHKADLSKFSECLSLVGFTVDGPLFDNPESWAGITWGLADGFISWQLTQGYSIRTINLRLGTVKLYANLAAKAGTLDKTENQMIQGLKAFSGSEARRVDEKRDTTRIGRKKGEWTRLTAQQVRELIDSCDVTTGQGRRDKLIISLLAYHGLRVSELASLSVDSFNSETNVLTWHRSKTGITSNHVLRNGTLRAMLEYLNCDAFENGLLLRSSMKNGLLTTQGWATQNINGHIKRLGKKAGIDKLSPHDLRHFGASQVAGKRATLKELMDWGGWSTPSVAMAYLDSATIDNETVNIDD